MVTNSCRSFLTRKLFMRKVGAGIGRLAVLRHEGNAAGLQIPASCHNCGHGLLLCDIFLLVQPPNSDKAKIHVAQQQTVEGSHNKTNSPNCRINLINSESKLKNRKKNHCLT